MTPRFWGGNYLPTLEDGEVEIARLTLDSVTRDVKVAYAKPVHRRIRIRVLDEYDTDYITAGPRFVSRPLTLGHFARYFVETIHLYDILEMNFVTYRESGGGDPLESALAFFTAQSDFYPGFDAACRRLVRHRCAQWTVAFKTAHKITKGNSSSIREASADDPIYTRGFAIGGYYSKASLPATPKTSSEPSSKPSSDDMIPSNE